MSSEFKDIFSLIFIFSNNLSKVLLEEKDKKLDGIIFKNNDKIDVVEISKKINNDINIKIEPNHFRLVLKLQNINKLWLFNIYMSVSEIENIKSEKYKVIDVENIPNNCHPTLKWLLPLSIDITVYRSGFNQILMK